MFPILCLFIRRKKISDTLSRRGKDLLENHPEKKMSYLSPIKNIWENACFPAAQVISAERGKFKQFKSHIGKELAHVAKEIACLHGKCKPACAPPLVVGDPLCLQAPSVATSDFIATTSDDWYPITIPVLPDSVLLSQNRNSGSTSTGSKITLTATGATLGKVGDPLADYLISFNVLLIRESVTPVVTEDLVVFASFNNQGSIDDPVTLARSAPLILVANQGISGERSFVATNVVGGTTLSLRAVGTTNDVPIPVSVAQWGIVVEQLQNGCKTKFKPCAPLCSPCPPPCVPTSQERRRRK